MSTNNKKQEPQSQQSQQPQVTLEDALKTLVIATKQQQNAETNLQSAELEFKKCKANLYNVANQVEVAMVQGETSQMKNKIEELEKVNEAENKK